MNFQQFNELAEILNQKPTFGLHRIGVTPPTETAVIKGKHADYKIRYNIEKNLYTVVSI
jgi:hypothetical protein